MSGHPQVGRFLGGSPDPGSAAAEHVASCPDCLTTLAADDPTRIFSLLRATPLAPDLLDAVSSAVAASVSTHEAPKRPARSRRWALVAAWASAAVLAGILLTPRSRPARDLAAVADGAPATPGPAAVDVVASPGVASVVNLSVGDVKLVMIFDKEMDL